MKAVYSPLNGVEAATAVAKAVTKLALTIPGFGRRIVTFPKIEIDIVVRVRCYDREPIEVSSFDELIDSLVAEGVETIDMAPVSDETYTVSINENDQSADAIRRGSDQTVLRPGLTESGRIADLPVEADPLPGKENMENILSAGTPGPISAGRVIDPGMPPMGTDRGDTIRPKLKGDLNATHFRVRHPTT